MIVNEGSTSSGTLSSMESSNIGMIWSCYGSMLTLFLKYPPTNVLCFSLRLIWTLSKIVKKCWKYSLKSSKLLLSLWLFKEFSHCIFEFMKVCNRKVNWYCPRFRRRSYPRNPCLWWIFSCSQLRENWFCRQKCHRTLEKPIAKEWVKHGHQRRVRISKKYEIEILFNPCHSGRKSKIEKIKIYPSWWSSRWIVQ